MKKTDFSNLLSLNLRFIMAELEGIDNTIESVPQTAKTKAVINKKIDNLATLLKSLKTLNT